MGGTEVDVVIENAAGIVSTLKELAGVGADDGIDGKETAEEYDVVGVKFGECGTDGSRSVIFVKLVVGVVVGVKESEGDMGLRAWIDCDVTGIYVIGLHEADNEAPHLIVARLGNHRGVEPASAQADEGVEGGTAGDGLLGLIVVEDYVVDGFAYSVDFAHVAGLHFECRIVDNGADGLQLVVGEVEMIEGGEVVLELSYR